MYGRDWRWKSLNVMYMQDYFLNKNATSIHDKNGEYMRAKTMCIAAILAPQGA